MTYKKRLFQPTLLAALLCGASIASLRAQEAGGDRPQPPHAPPPSPLFDALDTNHDGIISADEIANASAALKALLKNGATQLTREDVRPPHPAFARERHGRDEQGPPRTPPDIDSFRPHPPSPRGTDGAPAPEEHARPHHPSTDGADSPPRPGDDSARDAEDDERPGPFRHERFDRPSHHFAPRSPLFEALDANHDGVISADEIANAPAALKTLEKNGANQIKLEDLRPLPPPREND